MTVNAPASEAEACALVADAAAKRTPLAVGGRGTKGDFGRPAQTEATLSSTGLTGIPLYEPAEMVIGARTGTPLSEVQRLLAEKGQQLPFEPMDYRPLLGSSGEPTIGAVAATACLGCASSTGAERPSSRVAGS
jgi:glycolate dehydrogenase FAD-binding subunit